MFTFVCLGARDLARATQFYDVTMATLGHARCNVGAEPEWVGWVGWGTYEHWGARELALWVCSPFDGQPATVGPTSLRSKTISNCEAVVRPLDSSTTRMKCV